MSRETSSSGSVYGRSSGKSRRSSMYKRSSRKRSAYSSGRKSRTSDTRKSGSTSTSSGTSGSGNSKTTSAKVFIGKALLFFVGGVAAFLVINVMMAEDIGALIDSVFAALQKALKGS